MQYLTTRTNEYIIYCIYHLLIVHKKCFVNLMNKTATGIWITDPQRTDPEYLTDTKKRGILALNRNPGFQNRPISLARFGRDQSSMLRFRIFQLFRICPLGSVIHIEAYE